MEIGRSMTYKDIADELRSRIREKRMAPDSLLMSTRELAELYQVSPGTAYKAILQLVREDIVYRVKGSGTFVKRPTPKSVRKLTIGCSISSRQSDRKLEKMLYQPEKLAVDLLRMQNCDIKMIPNTIFAKNPNHEEYLSGLDGLLISTCAVYIHECTHLHSLKIPVMLFQGDCESTFPFHQVLPDSATGLRAMFQAAEFWKFEGITILSHNHFNGMYRKDMCEKIAGEFGYTDIETFSLDASENIYNLGLKIARNCRRRLIFSTTDTITFHLINAFKDCHLQPSEDYHLVGFDNVEGFDVKPYAVPTATAISYDREKAARIAVKTFLGELRNPSGFTHIIKVPIELIIRESGLNHKKKGL